MLLDHAPLRVVRGCTPGVGRHPRPVASEIATAIDDRRAGDPTAKHTTKNRHGEVR
jgi:hypothetical protein